METEVELTFSALSDLLAPVTDDLGALPGRQSAALAAALALGPPAPGDRLAVCVAALGLLRAAAVTRPVMVVVDDVQWLDAASRECILSLARRAGGSVALALCVRDPWDGLVGARLPGVRLGPLDGDASLRLLRGQREKQFGLRRRASRTLSGAPRTSAELLRRNGVQASRKGSVTGTAVREPPARR